MNPVPPAAPPRVLVVDDEPVMGSSLAKYLRAWGYDPVLAATVAEALEAFSPWAFAAVLLDLRLPDGDGVSVLRRVRELDPDVPVVMMSAYGTIGSAVEAVKAGAVDFIPKPLDMSHLQHLLGRAVEESRIRREVQELRRFADQRAAYGDLVGASPAMRRVYQLIEKVAAADVPVLIQGESGTGKELVARAIHVASGRRQGRFVALNCAAVPEPLIESEIFGHEKGAFTGAVARTIGFLEQAHGGTFFLDEVSEASLPFQTKLLRVLQDRAVVRVGGQEPVAVDARFLTATNRDLAAEVRAGRFREDLFYRINAVLIEIPPLRERKEDIPLLAEHLLARAAAQGRKTAELTPEAVAAFVRYPWPGNVRELEHVLERAIVLDVDGRIGLEDLPEPLRAAQGPAGGSEEGPPPGGAVPPAKPDLPLREAREAFERDYLASLLRAHRGNVSEAARQARLGRATFHEKLRRYGIDPDDYRE
jgi:DNA-binding NtrC family response regulator